MFRPQSQWFIHLIISIRGVLPWKRARHLFTVLGAPRGQKAYIQWGASWFPNQIVYTLLSLPSAMQLSAQYLPCLHTAITAQCHAAFSTIPSMFTHCYHCPVPCSLQHDTFHVDLGRPEPRYPTWVVVTLIRVYYHTCYHLPYDPGQCRVWIHITLRCRRGVGFMGGDDIVTVSLCDGELL